MLRHVPQYYQRAPQRPTVHHRHGEAGAWHHTHTIGGLGAEPAAWPSHNGVPLNGVPYADRGKTSSLLTVAFLPSKATGEGDDGVRPFTTGKHSLVLLVVGGASMLPIAMTMLT